MPRPPVRLIATDMDGTLLDSRSEIPERNLRAIKTAQEKGIVFAIASGRFPENAYLKLADFGVRCPIIGSNGARIVDEDLRTLREIRMDRQAALETAAILLDSGNDFLIFAHHMVCLSNENKIHHSEVSHGAQMRALGVSYYRGKEGVTRVVNDHIHKFFVCDNRPLEPVREALKAVRDIDLTQSSASNIEVMPKGVDKGKGVMDLAAILGIPMAQVMALGDEGNDVSMLSAAGLGVAVANASDAARSAARCIVGSNDACGFAQAVEEYAL